MKKQIQKCFIVAVLGMFLYSENSLPVSAAEKEISVLLNKQYAECVFHITMEEAKTGYQYFLVSPEGKKYDCTIADVEVTATIPNPVTGNWTVLIESEEDTAEIGKATVSVEGSYTQSQEVADAQVKIAQDIAGLTYYMKDDEFCVDWTDNNCGNVNIELVNIKTQQIIVKETVKEKQFRCPISPDVEQFTFSIVPSTSARIQEAVKIFTIEKTPPPEFHVTFPENKYVKETQCPVKVAFTEKYVVLAEVNGQEVLHTKTEEAGSYQYDIPIQEGSNQILLYIVDENGNMYSAKSEVICDLAAPLLSLNSDLNGISTTEEAIKVSGSVKDFTKIVMNEVPLEVLEDGRFEFEYPLLEGENHILIRATDEAGNESLYEAQIRKTVKQTFDFTKLLFLIIPVIVLLFLLKSVRRGKKQDAAPKKEKVTRAEKTADRTQATEKKDTSDVLLLLIKKWKFWGSFMLVLLISLTLRAGSVPSNSMEPTVSPGYIFYNKAAFLGKNPQRCDIVIIKQQGEKKLKRIIGLPGDTISFQNGRVVINNQVYQEEYLSEEDTNASETFTVPVDSYFLLGDNRQNSKDSRYWEDPYVKKKDILGKLLFKF